MPNAQAIVSNLLARFPDFAKDAFVAGKGPYGVLGEFARYLQRGLLAATLSPAEVKRAFEFLNELGDTRDIEVQNLLAVGVMETLGDEKVSVDAARDQLTGGALQSFEEVYRFRASNADSRGQRKDG